MVMISEAVNEGKRNCIRVRGFGVSERKGLQGRKFEEDY